MSAEDFSATPIDYEALLANEGLAPIVVGEPQLPSPIAAAWVTVRESVDEYPHLSVTAHAVAIELKTTDYKVGDFGARTWVGLRDLLGAILPPVGSVALEAESLVNFSELPEEPGKAPFEPRGPRHPRNQQVN